MSIESARAFVMRMMSDEEFRAEIGKAETAETITGIITRENYDFSKFDLLKIVGELTGKKVAAEELEKMVCGFYTGEVAGDGNPNAAKIVSAWFESLK